MYRMCFSVRGVYTQEMKPRGLRLGSQLLSGALVEMIKATRFYEG